MKNMDGRSEGLILNTAENINGPVRVGGFRITEARLGRVDQVPGLGRRDNRYLIVEPIGTLEVCLRQIGQESGPNLLRVQFNREPVCVFQAGLRPMRGCGAGDNGVKQSWDARFETPAR